MRYKAKGAYVGELQERWTFPSDHLPIGMTFDSIHIASWNVLDAADMDWVTKENSQGLSRSMIADEHIAIPGTKLTVRDRRIADLIGEMLFHPTHPRSLLALQECSEPLAEELRSRFGPLGFLLVSNVGKAVLLNTSLFEVIEAKAITGLFSREPQEPIQVLLLKRLDTGEQIRWINAHLPGDPKGPARFEFAKVLSDTFDPEELTLAMGDMNFNELEMADALQCPFRVYAPYCTNISPYTFFSKAIDLFLVYSPQEKELVLSKPDQLLSNLDRLLLLLERPEDHAGSDDNRDDAARL